jgi:hypothetical protein
MQDISIVLCYQNQEVVERSNLNFVDIFKAQFNLLDHPGILPWIETIDPYGNTIFNELQVKYFIQDMEKLKILLDDEKIKKLIDEIIVFSKKIIDEGPHLYLKFIGD